MTVREAGGRAIYESQQARNGRTDRRVRPWRSIDVPEAFWESFCLDAEAAYQVMSA